jgi:uncharacterized membrane protein/nitrite reductase/ring-hydroxylating ferredoxin subunit
VATRFVVLKSRWRGEARAGRPNHENAMIKKFLQGHWLGHPLHPMLVHLPIGLFLLSFVFDVATVITGLSSPSSQPTASPRSGSFVLPAFYTMSVGVVFALIAAIPGFADYTSIRRDHPARRTAVWHMLLNLAVVALYVVNLVLRDRRYDPFEPRVGVLPFALSLVAIALLSVSGYLGGKMVYADGVGVGRHRRRRGRTPRQTIVTDGLVSEADLAADGDSLRLDINDTIAAVARVDGEIYAFQEFCTHRFGPLSEGTFDGTRVRCPWHGSCFDMRTGKVTDGPAKEDIRAFEVVRQDGQVRIRVTGDA